MPMDHILQGATRRGGFVLEIDDRKLKITYPTYEERAAPVLRELASVEEHLLPLEKSKAELDKTAHRHSTRIAWLGLAALCAQWGIMARLTWWEYSWDVMEPISYFLTTGAGILGYMFYVATSKDYTYETLAALTVTKTQARLYRRAKLDLRRYMELRQQADKLRRKIDAIKQEYHVQ
ncbi:hypothetical protein BC832DRAFT_112070 [Gaertneriomyces semiglobifer]|nr:hypothetical protein BC832DRAFT_112070 [Gaertneriomyces semiglobifer]